MSVEARGGYRYVLTLTDDLSRYGYVYLMKHRSETFEKFKEFQNDVENQCDQGGSATSMWDYRYQLYIFWYSHYGYV